MSESDDWLGYQSQAMVEIMGPTPIWEVDIAHHPMTQTVVFEKTTDWKTWTPINGQRLEGPGPKIGTVWTNAVAGGPARFRGTCGHGIVGFRARCTRYDGVPIQMTIRTENGPTNGKSVHVVIIRGEGEVIFVIEEEKSLEDLLSEL